MYELFVVDEGDRPTWTRIDGSHDLFPQVCRRVLQAGGDVAASQVEDLRCGFNAEGMPFAELRVYPDSLRGRHRGDPPSIAAWLIERSNC